MTPKTGDVLHSAGAGAIDSVQSWVVCFSAALFFFFIFIQINMFNAIHPYLIRAFSVNAEQLGQISASYFYGNVLFLFPAGLALDRYSTRKIILLTMLLCIIGTTGFAFATTFWQAFLSRLLVGFAGAFCFISCVRLVSRWFSPRKMATVIGLIVTVAMCGGMVAQTPFALLNHILGWRHALLVDAGVGLVMLCAIFLWVQDIPKGGSASRAAPL